VNAIGHWFIKSIPFLGREFLALWGLIDSTSYSIKSFFSSKRFFNQQDTNNNNVNTNKEMWNKNINYCSDQKNNNGKNSDSEEEKNIVKQTFPVVRALKMEKDFEEINFSEKELKENEESEKKAALKQMQGKNIIVHPCGIGGKIVCCSLSNEENFNHKTKKIVIPIYKRERKGFITMVSNFYYIFYYFFSNVYCYVFIYCDATA
jgi:hypothetical protein